MGKEIHFYAYFDPSVKFSHAWNSVNVKIEKGVSPIHTTQMGLLETCLFEKGYRVFVHDSSKDVYEIKLGGDNERTGREIRLGHNIFKLWRAGEFERV